MKYIKAFESLNIEELKDVAVDITDKGYQFKQPQVSIGSKKYQTLSFDKYGKTFDGLEIITDLEAIESYLYRNDKRIYTIWYFSKRDSLTRASSNLVSFRRSCEKGECQNITKVYILVTESYKVKKKGIKLFESIQDFDIIKSEITDYLAHLHDERFYFDFKIKGDLQVEISRYHITDPYLREPFKWIDIQSEVKLLTDLMSDRFNFNIEKVYLSNKQIIAVRIDFYLK